MSKLIQEIKLGQNLWKGGFFTDINEDIYFKVKQLCIHDSKNKTVLEIGPGRGAWTKLMLDAKQIYCLDILSDEHNKFWEYIGDKFKNKIQYIHVNDFKCDKIQDNSIDFLFSFGVFCHISFTGQKEYMTNLYPKLKKGARCYIMVADLKKYLTYDNNPNPHPYSYGSELNSYDGEPSPGRWYWVSASRFSELLRQIGYTVICEDVDIVVRDPVVYFTKD